MAQGETMKPATARSLEVFGVAATAGSALGAIVYFLTRSPAATASAQNHAPVLVPSVPTGGTNRPEWMRSRFSALANEMFSHLLPIDRVMPLARFLLGQVALETGYGGGERNYNVGNLVCRGTPDVGRGWHGDCQIMGANADAGASFRSYTNLADGVADYFSLVALSARYRPAWLYLTQTLDGPGWYYRITAAGYSASDPTAGSREYAGVLDYIDRHIADR